MTNKMEGRRFVVRGRVQGVGFRWWTVREARKRGVVGTVRNREDGTVEVEATGTPEVLEGFGAALSHGPPAARVAGVQVGPCSASGSDEFRIVR